MNWLTKIADEIERRHPDGELIISSGVSPSGTYHVGHLREVLTADAVYLELKKRGRQVKHIHVVDDLDALRKIPPNIPQEFEKYLGQALSDVPAPDGSKHSFADFFFNPFFEGVRQLGVEIEIVRAHEKYRQGFFVPAIEKVLERADIAREVLESISGRSFDQHWSPIQVMEDEYLKNRRFISIDTQAKTVTYEDKDGKEQTAHYDKGEVKLDWRLDWPARWWLLGVNVEPFGRDHATKGGSYDTGVGLAQKVFETDPPIPVPYDFINRAGDTKKMSASKGTGIDIAEVLKVLPPEVVRYFVLRYAPSKQLFFDSGKGTMQLMDEFAELAAKPDRNKEEDDLIHVCTKGVDVKTVSRIPFSHLVASYQAALKDVDKTLEIISRTEHAKIVDEDKEIIKTELKYIDEWLKSWAPEDVKFELAEKVAKDQFNENQVKFLSELANKIEKVPEDTDGEWFHQAIYEFKDSSGLEPKELFGTLYKVLINKDAGPRAGWFLSILPHDWLIKRLRFEV